MDIFNCKSFFLVFLAATTFSCGGLLAQTNNLENSEFLENASYDELYELIGMVYEDTIQSKKFIRRYLEKAQQDKNQTEESIALGWLALYTKEEKEKLNLLDKSIELSEKNTVASILPYSFKGAHYLNKRDFNTALENYLIALEISKRIENIDYEFITKHNIGIIKGEIGKNEEALELFRESFKYEKSAGDLNSHGYITSLLYMAEYLIKLDSLQVAHTYIDEGLIKSKNNFTSLYTELLVQKGILKYKSKDLKTAKNIFMETLQLIDKELPQHRKPYILIHFYLGQIENTFDNPFLAVKNYKSMDSIVQAKKYPLGEIRLGYKYLVEFYKKNGQVEEALLYLNKLLRLDSINSLNGIQLNQSLFTNFDTPDLLESKNEIIKELEKGKSNIFNISLLISCFAIIALGLAFAFLLQNRRLKQNFQKLIDKSDNEVGQPKKNVEEINRNFENKISLPKEIVNSILKQLDDFEKNNKFLNNKITLKSMADEFNTNTKYLSMIINHLKEKNFSNYIKDLRIEFAIKELKRNQKIRNKYTIEGMSKEFGFNNSESFSIAFKKQTGLKPSYFIKELNKLGLNS